MPQETVWDNEYRDPKLVTKDSKPQKDVLKYLKSLRKDGVDFDGLITLDLGSGTGRNANHLATLGCRVTGIELSVTAIKLARERALKAGLDVTYLHQSMDERFPYDDACVDLILDVTSSNSLTEAERVRYLAECDRVLKPGGHMFVKTLCKDGDKNAKMLIATHPGPEHDTYINPDMGLTERVFTREDLTALYVPYFTIDSLQQKTNYTRFNNQSYKRNFWLLSLTK